MEFVRLTILLGTLLYGSYYDWKSRDVSDSVWIISSMAGNSVQLYKVLFARLHMKKVSLTGGTGQYEQLQDPQSTFPYPQQ